jgi:hypothetical protein
MNILTTKYSTYERLYFAWLGLPSEREKANPFCTNQKAFEQEWEQMSSRSTLRSALVRILYTIDLLFNDLNFISIFL